MAESLSGGGSIRRPTYLVRPYPLRSSRVRVHTFAVWDNEWTSVLSLNVGGYTRKLNLPVSLVYPSARSRTWSVPLFALCYWLTFELLGIVLRSTLLGRGRSSGANARQRCCRSPGRLRGTVRPVATRPTGTGPMARPSRPFRKPFDPQLLTAFPYLDTF
jgi:hypothetical protein